MILISPSPSYKERPPVFAVHLSNSTVHRLSWPSYDPRHMNSTHFPLTKFLPKMQKNRFCSTNPRRNGFIDQPHLAVKFILYRLNLLFFLFWPYPISHFASFVHYYNVPIGRSGVRVLPFLHCEQYHSQATSLLAIDDCPAFSSSQHHICHHNRGYFYCLCCVVAYEGRHRRDPSRSDYLSSVHAALNLRSFLGAG